MKDHSAELAAIKKFRASEPYPADSRYMRDTDVLFDRINELEAHLILVNQRYRAEQDRRPAPPIDPAGVSAVSTLLHHI